MLTLEQIDHSDIMPYVRIAFEGDGDLLEKYHISPGGIDHCVKDTVKCIHENAVHFKEDFACYKVVKDGEDIGYTVCIIDENNPCELYSFGINKAHRKADVLREWLERIKEKLGSIYFTILWRKNKRAINFFEKNGFREERGEWDFDFTNKILLVCRLEDSLVRE